MSKNAIEIKNVYKHFKIYKDKPLSMKEKILRLRSSDYEVFNAVNGVNIEVKKGETVGLIGHNGCGKSTLLKLISQILYPDKGEIVVNGRISSLIELGAGFHPDFTGRENIYMNGSIYGLSNKDIDKKIDEIIRFSELEHFIENPVRTYSSGMYMRLAFSVAINVNPEILLIDEILSVGDTNFQKKCYEKIEGFQRSGATVLIVAHDLGTLEKLCDKIIWMDKGKVVNQGEPDYVINLYKQYMNEQYVENKVKENEQLLVNLEESDYTSNEEVKEEKGEINKKINDLHWGSGEIKITNVNIMDDRNRKVSTILAGKATKLEIDYKVLNSQEEVIFGIGIYSEDYKPVYGTNTELDKIKLKNLEFEGKIVFEIPKLQLLTGKYILSVAIEDKNHRALDFYKNYMEFDIVSQDPAVGIHSIEHKWIIK